MASKCNACGQSLEPGSAFCQHCGTAVFLPQEPSNSLTNPQAGDAQLASQKKVEPVGRVSGKRMTLGLVAIFLAIAVGAGAYWYSIPPEASPQTFAEVLTEHFSAKSGDIDDLICLPIGLFDHREHVRVNVQTERWRFNWVNLLALEGLYTQELARGVYANFKRTDAGQKVIRNGRLCFAEGVDSIQVKEFRESDKGAQPRWAIVRFTYRYSNLAKWAQSDSANYLTSNFFKKSDIGSARVLVLKGRQWVVSEDANFIKSVANSAQNNRRSLDHSTALNQAKPSSFVDRLKNLFSGSPSIVGKWAGDGEELEFFEDKTLVLSTHNGPFAGDDSGTWIQLDDGRIKMEFTVMGMKAPPSFAELHGDTLHVTMDRNVQFDVRKVK